MLILEHSTKPVVQTTSVEIHNPYSNALLSLLSASTPMINIHQPKYYLQYIYLHSHSILITIYIPILVYYIHIINIIIIIIIILTILINIIIILIVILIIFNIIIIIDVVFSVNPKYSNEC